MNSPAPVPCEPNMPARVPSARKTWMRALSVSATANAPGGTAAGGGGGNGGGENATDQGLSNCPLPSPSEPTPKAKTPSEARNTWMRPL